MHYADVCLTKRWRSEDTSIMDKGCEWQARKAFPSGSAGGEVLFDRVEHWDSEEWQRWILESKSFSSPAQLVSFHGLNTNQLSWPESFSLSDVMSDLENSRRLRLGVVKGDFILSSFADGDKEDVCWSNAFLYSERRYCSKYPTSASNTAISLMSSVAGWKNQRNNILTQPRDSSW